MYNYSEYDENLFGNYFNEESINYIKEDLEIMNVGLDEISEIALENILNKLEEMILEYNENNAESHGFSVIF